MSSGKAATTPALSQSATNAVALLSADDALDSQLRLEHLWSLGMSSARCCSGISRYFMRRFTESAATDDIAIGEQHLSQYCVRCGSIFAPGRNATVRPLDSRRRARSRRKMGLHFHCHVCNRYCDVYSTVQTAVLHPGVGTGTGAAVGPHAPQSRTRTAPSGPPQQQPKGGSSSRQNLSAPAPPKQSRLASYLKSVGIG